MFIKSNSLSLGFSDDLTRIASLLLFDKEVAGSTKPLFSMRLRDADGNPAVFDAKGAERSVKWSENSAFLTFDFRNITVHIEISGGNEIIWKLGVENNSDLAVEYIDFPAMSIAGRLRKNGGDAFIVSSYNEGLLVEDSRLKTGMTDPEYPSMGGYMMFPYMVSTQFMLWMNGQSGLYMGVHDADRAPKGLDFACGEDETEFRVRLFMGGNYGENVSTPDIVWKAFEGGWEDGADIYREWLKTSFDAKPLAGLDLPDWYRNDLPLVITYPVRGIHDMDEMKPNRLFPYENVLPLVDEFSKKTNSRVMVLLMHWEGTAPWAPPYVFPPYGGVEMFSSFMRKLHDSGNLLGVYCSGLSFTEQSNLIASYNRTDEIREKHLDEGFCRAPDQSMPKSRICTGQRSGYDICAASEVGKKILDEALEPLLTSGVDYVQALDQNHGGGMYFCYSKSHGHPPVPGAWMTKASKELLSGWKKLCPETLLGCESAAAEPYINELRLSDNRYELCYSYGKAIPLYSYLFHPYLRNFMGNQVSCPLAYTTELLELRLAHSFVAGDMLTLVLNDDGEVMFHWGMRDFSKTPDRAEIIDFVAVLQSWHRKYPELFAGAEMVRPVRFKTDELELEKRYGQPVSESAVLSTAWKVREKRIQLFVNWTHEVRTCSFDSDRPADFPAELKLKPLGVAAIEF